MTLYVLVVGTVVVTAIMVFIAVAIYMSGNR